MDKAAIFIDSGYLNKLGSDYFNIKPDIRKVINEMSGDYELFRAYYYYCSPYISPYPTDEEKKRQRSHNSFIHNLRNIERLELRKGRLEKRGNEFKQKRVDILMAVDIIRLSWKNQIHAAVLMTGDSDFVPAINDAKNSGIIIKLFYHKDCVHDELITACDVRVEITRKMFKSWEFTK